jgi:pimeloyl-ACP methyl ester carboxylesterase
MTPSDLSFVSGGDQCAAWHFAAADDSLAGPGGRPVVVMAHGLGGTKDSGLAPFAEGLAAAGLEVFAFDYRGFGASAGEPRQTVSIARQVDDYLAAMAAAARLPGVDPDRLVLWGVSVSGGHVLEAGAGRADVAAVVSITPLVSGAAAGLLALSHHKKSSILRSTVAGVRSKVGSPVMMPIVARPDELGAMTLDGAYEAYTAMAGPTWRNEIDASIGLELGGLRPGRFAKDIVCPLFVQIADFDRSAPPQATAKAAFKGRALVRHYPCDHFDVWPGGDQFDAVLAHQVAFLRRVLSPAGVVESVT